MPRAEKDTTCTPRQDMARGRLSHPIPERCFHDLFHRHGFESKDAVGLRKSKLGAPQYFPAWSKVVGLDQSPLRQAIGERMPCSYLLCLLPPNPFPTPNSGSRGYPLPALLFAGMHSIPPGRGGELPGPRC